MLQGHAGLNGDAIPHTVNAEDGVWAEVCVVTPAIARDWIQVNTKNRRIRSAKVDQYDASMRAGRWAFNGQAIVFDVHGRLMNGQHRLLACIKAGVSFKVLVVHGVDAEAFDTLDTGAARTAGDILGIAGVSLGIGAATNSTS